MPKRHTLHILPRAEDDVAAIYSWLLARSQIGARNWFHAFEQMLDRVENSPEQFSEAREAKELDRPLKQALFKTPKGRTYRAVFITDDQFNVFILRLRGPGQPNLKSDEA